MPPTSFAGAATAQSLLGGGNLPPRTAFGTLLHIASDDPFTTADEAAEFYAAAYRKYIFLRGTIDRIPNELLDPSGFKLPRRARSFLREIELATAEDFARLAANRVNGFLLSLLGLKSWQAILPEYKERQAYYLKVEFVWPLVQLAMAEPSGIKDQIAFSAVKMAILTESHGYDAAIPPDDSVRRSDLDGWVGKWHGYDRFAARLRALNSRSFIAQSLNFRNRRAHGLAPSLLGIVPAHAVSREGRDWLMTCRHDGPLELDKITDVLVDEHLAAVALVEELRALFRVRFSEGID